MKFYDFDGMFDAKLTDYMQKNSGKYSESEWEDIIPKLYEKFGDTYIKSVGDTPNGFYSKLTPIELITALKTHIKKGVPVCKFLCNAIERANATSLLMPLLDASESEREFAVSLIGSADGVIGKYMKMLVSPDCSQELKDSLLDAIKEKADLVTDEAADNYEKGIERGLMLEIMSRSVIHTDRVFDILIKEFRSDPENIALNAAMLATYGDERALPFLLDKIDEEGISFLEYKELLLAIESLGGVYEKDRDFSQDPYFELIKSHEGNSADIFGTVDKK